MSEQRIQQAIQLIDEINQCDPVSETVDGIAQPKEWLYGVRMSECLAEGYNQWRQSLGRLHAEEAMAIAEKVGCAQDEVQSIGRMLRKEKLKRDPQVQALEDVICLVFLKYYFTAFSEKHTSEKLIVIVQKTWAKMSEKGHEAALKLPFTLDQQALLAKALG
ncbi:DUF4202 domain-containing protein [Moritella viscosa]